MQAGALGLIQALIQVPASAWLGCFMAAQAAGMPAELGGERVRHRLAQHAYLIPTWLALIDSLASTLPAVDNQATHTHLLAGYSHLLDLIHGLGCLTSGNAHPAHPEIMLASALS